MDSARFDRLTRILASIRSRRGLITALGLASIGVFDPITARTKHKHKHKRKKTKLQKNAFGCVNVGKFCKHDRQCCSGVCQGKKGRKQCKAHHTGGCHAGQRAGLCGGDNTPCTSSAGESGICQTTTGNAGYCQGSGFACMPCRTDADCRALVGPAAACIPCGAIGCETACVAPQDWE
jgi:hypothetical protein